jgi:hypothetical protein
MEKIFNSNGNSYRFSGCKIETFEVHLINEDGTEKLIEIEDIPDDIFDEIIQILGY